MVIPCFAFSARSMKYYHVFAVAWTFPAPSLHIPQTRFSDIQNGQKYPPLHPEEEIVHANYRSLLMTSSLPSYDKSIFGLVWYLLSRALGTFLRSIHFCLIILARNSIDIMKHCWRPRLIDVMKRYRNRSSSSIRAGPRLVAKRGLVEYRRETLSETTNAGPCLVPERVVFSNICKWSMCPIAAPVL